ncbi:MAG: BatD family protein [Rikenellaceae bacterium]|nr:BatD family protein [Rikenellaceae bacterium]
MGRRMPLWAVMMLFCSGLWAQQIDFTAGAPQMVEAGVPFRIEFTATVNTSEITPSGFTLPPIHGADVIAGPSEARGQNFMSINGRRSESYTYTYTYVLVAESEGRLEIPQASITADSKQYTSQPLKIDVVAGGAASSGGSSAPPSRQPGTQGQNPSPSTNTLQRDDVVLRVIPSRTQVYKGEPIRLVLKIYTRHDLDMQNLKSPALTGFWSQDIQSSSSEWQQEELNGKLYHSLVLREYLAFPQQSGTLTIDQFSLTANVRLITQSRRQSIFDDFFGGGPQMQQVPMDVHSNAVSIQVKEWPAGAPAGFQGAVGQFKLEGGPSQTQLSANSSANFDLRISGSGNLPLITPPEIEMPTSFEQYAVKTTDGYTASASNITGTKTFSTPFIARAEGEYTIPPVEFVYFDPSSERYQTLRTPNYTMHIGEDTGSGGNSPGLVSGVSKEELKILGEDIRFIRISDPRLRKSGSVFLYSAGYWIVLLIIIAAFAGAMLYLQKQIKFRNNTTLVRNKRAQKVALRRLKSAEKNMLAKNNAGFYEEMLKALWGYMSDKLNIPAANLSRDNVREGLAAKGVEPEWIDRYIEAIAECEYMQYAPSDKTQIGDVYNAAVELISKMESKI